MSYCRFNGKHFVVIGLGRPISAIVLVIGVMVNFVPLLTACETCHGIVVSTFLRDVVGLSTFVCTDQLYAIRGQHRRFCLSFDYVVLFDFGG